MTEIYLFLLALMIGFGFALGGVVARAIERLVRFEVSLRECRRRTLLRFTLDQEMEKVKAGAAAEAEDVRDFKPVLADVQPAARLVVFDPRGGNA